jgi:molecular chaperone DnaK (HSP70)
VSRLAVGIDLGTTNSALAYVREGDGRPSPLPIPQIVAAGEVGERPLLPSFVYLPAEGQLPDGALALPWDPGAHDAVVGAFARAQGATTPVRVVASAKSWLSHAGVDRRGAILPWGAPDEVKKISPVGASARYLAHLRAAWEAAHSGTPLASQDVVLTVPASFDAVARELTIEATRLAGFAEPPLLLEEPQAAMYDWLAQRGDAWRQDVAVGDVILVVDIGGGTTDFSLICVQERDGTLELERVAVGDHILLGGDNMDLALAYGVRARLLAEGKALDDWQMGALVHGCRTAKEALLGGEARDEHPLAVPGRGSKLIGGTLRTTLRRAELDSVLLDGFFPEVRVDAPLAAPRRAGLLALGLPYPADAAMTRHLAAFLRRSGGARRTGRHSFVHPTAILFNGGVTRAPMLRDRIVTVIRAWVEAEGGVSPRVLESTDPELAVCRGAAYYARARREGGIRIRGGTAQAYYVGIERSELAVPGMPPRVDAVCIAPFRMEEGSEISLDQVFGLVLGEPVSFRFFGSAARKDDVVGTVVKLGELVELAPIETTLEGPAGEIAQVRLRGAITEIGTLELSAVEEASGRSFKMTFDVRGAQP